MNGASAGACADGVCALAVPTQHSKRINAGHSLFALIVTAQFCIAKTETERQSAKGVITFWDSGAGNSPLIDAAFGAQVLADL